MVPARTAIFVSFLGAALAGCESDARSPKGFALPDGDAAAGREAFVELQCFTCHELADGKGEGLPVPTSDAPAHVVLGGEIVKVKTYGDLVTSIINPSHKIAPGYRRETVATDGESRMANYNSTMTVQELIDLVAFLQSTYKVVPPPFEYYPYP